MADRGRDLKISVLSDADRFDLSDPADQLERLGDNAKDAGRDLDKTTDELRRLALQGQDAQRELDRLNAEAKGNDIDALGKDAKDTATKVDSAFERIAASSKSNLRKVDDDLDRAGKGMDDFKDEAQSTAREAGASFSGSFDDVADTIQEVAANAFAGFGPLGAAAGLAAAAGMGYVISKVQESRERVKELTGAFLDLRKQGIDPAADSAAHLADELDAAQLSQFKRDADELGLSYEVLKAAFDGNAEAIETARNAIKRYNDENARGNPMTGEQADLHERLSIKLNETEQAYKNSADAAAFLGSAQQDAADSTATLTKAMEDHANAIDSFVDPVTTYTELLAEKERKEQESAQKTADATKSQKDSWEDYAKDVDVSVEEYLATLEKQVKAQEEWAGNLQTLAKRGVDQGVLAELERMGPEGAPLIAKLTTASDKELGKMVSLFGRQGAASGQAVASNLVNQSGAVSKSAKAVRDAAAVQLAKNIQIPVSLSDITPDLRRQLAQINDFYRRNPPTASVRVTAPGHTRDVP